MTRFLLAYMMSAMASQTYSYHVMFFFAVSTTRLQAHAACDLTPRIACCSHCNHRTAAGTCVHILLYNSRRRACRHTQWITYLMAKHPRAVTVHFLSNCSQTLLLQGSAAALCMCRVHSRAQLFMMLRYELGRCHRWCINHCRHLGQDGANALNAPINSEFTASP